MLLVIGIYEVVVNLGQPIYVIVVGIILKVVLVTIMMLDYLVNVVVVNIKLPQIFELVETLEVSVHGNVLILWVSWILCELEVIVFNSTEKLRIIV